MFFNNSSSVPVFCKCDVHCKNEIGKDLKIIKSDVKLDIRTERLLHFNIQSDIHVQSLFLKIFLIETILHNESLYLF